MNALIIAPSPLVEIDEVICPSGRIETDMMTLRTPCELTKLLRAAGFPVSELFMTPSRFPVPEWAMHTAFRRACDKCGAKQYFMEVRPWDLSASFWWK